MDATIHFRFSLNCQSAAVAPLGASFDVVSVRPSDPNNLQFSIRPLPGNLAMHAVTLKFLIQYAFDVHDYQVREYPRWAETDKFDIHAKMDDPSESESKDWERGQELLRLRLRSLLKARFNLVAHETKKNGSLLAIKQMKTAAKLGLGKPEQGYSVSQGLLNCNNSSMDDLAYLLSAALGTSVIDQTGLKGNYSFELRWSSEGSALQADAPPTIATAIREQLGLQLVKAQGLIKTVIVEHADRPTTN